MEKEFIPYKWALELKELEFDEPCLAFYWITGKFYITAEYHNYVGFHKQNQLGDYNYDSTSAPTFSQAFRFFREKYGIFIMVEKDAIGDYYGVKRNDDYPFNYYEITKTCESYEEAELECLKKLIEIVKNK